MALYIKDPRADKLAGKLAAMLHSNKTRVVVDALEEKYARESPLPKQQEDSQAKLEAIQAIVRRYRQRPVTDPRSPEEILGFDEHGLP